MNKNNPIKLLIDEHEIISSAKSIIKKIDKLWENDSKLYESKVNSLINFFREYGDKFHHNKEEKILFKELKSNSEFHLPDLIDELANHHTEFRELLSQIEEKLNSKNWNESYLILNTYFQNLLDHISVENTELFSIAENIFNENELTKIFFLFEDSDREIGFERKLQLPKMLNGLN